MLKLLSAVESEPVAVLNEVIPLVALESPLLVEDDNEVIPLVALESPLLVDVLKLPVAVESDPVEVLNEVVAVELAFMEACCAFKLVSCEASWELSC